LFHYESASIGPLKVSHLWKGVLLGFLIVKVFIRGRIKSSLYNPFFLLVIMGLFSSEIVYNPLNAIFTFSTTVIIPLIGLYALDKDSVWCKKALHFLSAFFILCFIPYEVGLLTPLGEGYDIARSYGFAVQGSIGPFQTAHSASTALAGALLAVLYFLLTSAYSRTWLLLLFLLGLYLLFNTFVRTGMVMFAIGSLMMTVSFARRSQRMLFRVSLFSIVLVPLVSTWVLSNDALMARILGQRSYNSELSSFETLGSGRGGLALESAHMYLEANFIEKVLGMGITEQKQRMSDRTGKALVPHNGFLALLLHNGLVGLVLFICFLFSLWTSMRKLRDPNGAAFLFALYSAYIIMTFFQTYHILYMPVLMMISYAMLKKSDKELSLS